jgi:hypothetical protein
VAQNLEIERRPAAPVVRRDLHRPRPQSSVASRRAAGLAGFFALSQAVDFPEP